MNLSLCSRRGFGPLDGAMGCSCTSNQLCVGRRAKEISLSEEKRIAYHRNYAQSSELVWWLVWTI